MLCLQVASVRSKRAVGSSHRNNRGSLVEGRFHRKMATGECGKKARGEDDDGGIYRQRNPLLLTTSERVARFHRCARPSRLPFLLPFPPPAPFFPSDRMKKRARACFVSGTEVSTVSDCNLKEAKCQSTPARKT